MKTLAKWQTVPIKSVYEGLYDGPHATPAPCADGPVFLGIKNITDDGALDLTDIRHISESEFPRWTKRVNPEAGDIVFTYEATLNRYAIIPDGFRGCLGRRMALIRTNPGKVDTRFLHFYFFSKQWRKVIASNILTGATVDRIPLTKFPDFPITIPDLPTQRKIAGILSAYDDLIENNLRRIKILEDMAQSLYREWFVHFRFPGHESAKFVESSLGQIPEGWEVKTAGYLIGFHVGGGWGKEAQDNTHCESAYVIRGTDIPSARLCDRTSVPFRYHTESNLRSRRLEVGDIVFEVSGGSKGQPVGRALFVSKNLLDSFEGEDVMCASFCKLLRTDTKVIASELFYYHLKEIYDDGRIDQYQVQSTGITNFKFAPFLDQELVVVPPQNLQEKWIQSAVPFLQSIQTLGQKCQNLRHTRDLLLPKLVSAQF